MAKIEKNCISYWLPKILDNSEKFNFLVPKTAIYVNDFDLSDYVDSRNNKEFKVFDDLIKKEAGNIGYPLFLRTGVTAAKFDWKNTCFVEKPEDLIPHIFNLVEWSQKSTFFELPYNVWAIRQFVPMQSEAPPLNFTAFSGQMPINKERRIFIRDGKVECFHNYWSGSALEGNCSDTLWATKLAFLNNTYDYEEVLLRQEAEKIASVFEGYWSLDFCLSQSSPVTKRGVKPSGNWYLIDMALGDDSYHQPGCPYHKSTSDWVVIPSKHWQMK